jgi:hypothetical protein
MKTEDDKAIDVLIGTLSEGNASTRNFFEAIKGGTLIQAIHTRMNKDKLGLIGRKPDLIGKIWEIFNRDLDEVNLFYSVTPDKILMMMMLMQGTSMEQKADETLLRLSRSIQKMRKNEKK